MLSAVVFSAGKQKNPSLSGRILVDENDHPAVADFFETFFDVEIGMVRKCELIAGDILVALVRRSFAHIYRSNRFRC